MREFPVFDRELLQYLPEVMRDAEEMIQLLNAENPEVFQMWEAVQRVMDEQFFDTMSDYGVSRWERILRIIQNPGDTLEQRKDRILLILRMKTPYTIRWLRAWRTETVGEDNFDISIDRYTINLKIHYDKIIKAVHFDVLDLLGWVKPSNMVLGFKSVLTSDGVIRVTGYPESLTKMSVNQTLFRNQGAIILCPWADILVKVNEYELRPYRPNLPRL